VLATFNVVVLNDTLKHLFLFKFIKLPPEACVFITSLNVMYDNFIWLLSISRECYSNISFKW